MRRTDGQNCCDRKNTRRDSSKYYISWSLSSFSYHHWSFLRKRAATIVIPRQGKWNGSNASDVIGLAEGGLRQWRYLYIREWKGGSQHYLVSFCKISRNDLFHYFAAFRFQSLLRFVIISKAGGGLICSLIISFLNNLLRVPFFFYSLGREGTGAGPLASGAHHHRVITLLTH